MENATRSPLRRWAVRKLGGEERALRRESLPSVLFPSPVAGTPITDRSALGLVDVLACTRLLAESASLLPLHAYRETPQGRQRHDGALADLLDRPSPGTTQANLVAQLVGSLVLRGEGFLGKFRAQGEVAQLALLPVDQIEVKIVAGGEPVYRYHHDPGSDGSGPMVTEHTTADVIHVRGLSLDGIRGVSPIRYAREAFGLAAALQQEASALVANASCPKGVLVVPGGPGSTDVLENLRKQWEARHGGSQQAGRVAVLSSEVKFEAVSLSPQDAQFIESQRLSSVQIARVFRVPPSLVNVDSGQSLTYSTSESEALNFTKFSLAPHLRVIEAAISNDPDLCPGNLYVQFVLDALLRADSESRARVYTAALNPQTGWLRREEVRELEDRPPEAQPPAPLPSTNGNSSVPAGVA